MVVERVVDPFEPPMPPRIGADQALKFAESLARGEPDRKVNMLNVMKQRINEMIAGAEPDHCSRARAVRMLWNK